MYIIFFERSKLCQMVLEKKSSLEEMVLSHYAKFMDPLIISQIANLQGIERAIYNHF